MSPSNVPRRPKSFNYWSVHGESDVVDYALVLAHMQAVSISKLFAILIAAAMLFAPFAMQSGAMAAMPSDHHSQMTEKGHCEGQSGTDDDSKPADKPCCAAMCTAVAVPAPGLGTERIFAPLPAHPLAANFYQGFLSEIATPPPRLA